MPICLQKANINNMFLEKKINVDNKTNKLIDLVLGTTFPWFYINQLHDRTNYKYFGHILLARSPELKNNIQKEGIVNSNYYERFETIFMDFCNENNIKVNNILRMALNNTWHCEGIHSEIHTDHNFPHFNFLWYINDFTKGSTYVYEEDYKTLKKEIKAEKDKAVVFGGEPHASGFCGPNEHRIVLVTTFN